ncbi:MAG: Fur family transcriptional regulator [Acidobacteriota bacterium]
METPDERLARLRELAEARRLRMTPQRDVLLRALSRTTGHPTADELYQRVRKVLPSISHATVYRNVQDLVRAGLLAPLERAGAAVQYDVNADDHHHFVCRRCGKVWDIYLSDVGYEVDRRRSAVSGMHIDRAEVQLYGVCRACRARKDEGAPRTAGSPRAPGVRRSCRPPAGHC